jgi:hypothetical protein
LVVVLAAERLRQPRWPPRLVRVEELLVDQEVVV